MQFGEHTLELAPPWARVTMRDALIEHAGIDFEEFRTRDKLLEELQRRKLSDIDPGWSWSKLLDEAVSHYVEPKLIQPTFLLDYPKEISPLAKSKPGAPGIVERFEVFCAGFELGNAYSELNDPIDQRERFETQARLAAAGPRRSRDAGRGLPHRARARDAADGRLRHGHRPAGDDPHRADVDPRSDPLPAAAEEGGVAAWISRPRC